jgi:hypothetical protein
MPTQHTGRAHTVHGPCSHSTRAVLTQHTGHAHTAHGPCSHSTRAVPRPVSPDDAWNIAPWHYATVRASAADGDGNAELSNANKSFADRRVTGDPLCSGPRRRAASTRIPEPANNDSTPPTTLTMVGGTECHGALPPSTSPATQSARYTEHLYSVYTQYREYTQRVQSTGVSDYEQSDSYTQQTLAGMCSGRRWQACVDRAS